MTGPKLRLAASHGKAIDSDDLDVAVANTCKTDQASEASHEPRKVNVEPPMSDLTRQEIESRLSATESRVVSALSEMRGELATFRADVRTGAAELRVEMIDLRAGATKDVTDLHVDMHKGFRAQTKWIVGTGLSAAGLIATALALLEPYSNPPQPPAPPQAAPTVILVPNERAANMPPGPYPEPISNTR